MDISLLKLVPGIQGITMFRNGFLGWSSAIWPEQLTLRNFRKASTPVTICQAEMLAKN
jgi:hypothetical protein